MSAVFQKSSRSSATDMIRAEHSRVMAEFHRFDPSDQPAVQRALVETICLSLEMHSEIEEEILYPAAKGVEGTTVEKNEADHVEMRRLITALRVSDPASETYEANFMELMRLVMHHVADEETKLLPAVDRLPRETLRDLSARMSQRRARLMMDNFGAMASNKVRAAPAFVAILAGVGVLAALAVGQAMKRR